MTLEQLEKEGARLVKIAKELSAEKKRRFSHIDISEPMSAEEKELNELTAKAWGDVDNVVRAMNKLKKQP